MRLRVIPKYSLKYIGEKTIERMAQLKKDSGEVIESGEDKSTAFNDYFLSDFTKKKKNLATISKRFHVYMGENNAKLRDVHIARQIVQVKISRLKKKQVVRF